MARAKRGKRYFGSVRELPSGRHQARYTGPDGVTYSARRPNGKALTFDTQGDADAWLALRHSEILLGAWLPPAEPKPEEATPITVREYCEAWLTDRDLEQTTIDHYRQILDDHIYPTFENVAVISVTPASVRQWFAQVARGDGKKVKDRPTARAHAYGLLRTIMNTAVADEVRDSNPCRVRGGGSAKRVKKIRPASLAELEAVVWAIPERYKLMVLLAAWCAMRFGELAELRRADVDTKRGVVHIRRGVTRTKGKRIVKDPKSDAGKREVNIPPHLIPMVKNHLRDHVAGSKVALLFPATSDNTRHMAPSSLYRVFYPAREKAGRDDLRFHDLRHTGAVLAAATGATLAELMARLGHSTPGAAMRYQHAAADRDKVIAQALSDLAGGTVTPIRPAVTSDEQEGDASAATA
ncbi:tyrosine-type recombinase/integrase [Umezawaea sp. Da 62-37]|uniref:tyrosine-type recombinase/integrase n=1 Tax=Umezawaea sp. Da 62-37 TaxID=3075927 RepID=UPI0028F73444|nr:tyrosine-type recombinase/integrase [Umezawaea sp. Da 62-37]WNV89035.1 tyrosine-type recombinase/integrase [Umezawaea sp. Da 62-37]